MFTSSIFGAKPRGSKPGHSSGSLRNCAYPAAYFIFVIGLNAGAIVRKKKNSVIESLVYKERFSKRQTRTCAYACTCCTCQCMFVCDQVSQTTQKSARSSPRSKWILLLGATSPPVRWQRMSWRHSPRLIGSSSAASFLFFDGAHSKLPTCILCFPDLHLCAGKNVRSCGRAAFS